MKKARAGLLPFYLKLYDQCNRAWLKPLQKFAGSVRRSLKARGIEVDLAPVCRVEREFKAAVRSLEKKGADALITLHLAYSPSLESISALSASPLPVIVLDTTPGFEAGPGRSPDFIMQNHGIHGVQDLCNLLLRRQKPFIIEAGHWEKSDVLDRVADHVRGARMARALKGARVGLIGEAFAGMGDFSVEPEKLKSDLGMTVVPVAAAEAAALMPSDKDRAVAREMALDRKRFACGKIDENLHRETTRACLCIRRLLEQKKLSAFSLNFQTVTKASGIPAMPFLEISKAMARGTGYAGEGDTLTAGLVGALMTVFPDSSFTEMFCPDWKGNQIFLSHMGEINLNLAERKPFLFEKEWIFSDARKPVAAAAAFKPGPAVFVNLAPQKQGYALILAPVEMVSEGKTGKFKTTIRGWFRPGMPVADFLAAYSRAGGTHHAALVYGAATAALESFGRIMGFRIVRIG
jgi:L-arabinose isomerase